MKSIYIFLAEGYEPLEALAPMDILRRAKLDAKFVSLDASRSVTSTQGYAITADLTWDEFIGDRKKNETACLIFPGGLPGADTLGQNKALADILNGHFDKGALTCAICAAPARVLARNLGDKVTGRRMTCYEGFEEDLAAAGAVPTAEGVTVDGNLITAKGPGLAVEFGLAILSALVDPRIHGVVKGAMML